MFFFQNLGIQLWYDGDNSELNLIQTPQLNDKVVYFSIVIALVLFLFIYYFIRFLRQQREKRMMENLT